MRKEYEASGKTVDAAIDAACLLAGTTIENVEIEILELGGKGLFGFGHKDARVKVILELPDAPAAEVKPETTFGTKKSKRERFEQKVKKTEDIEIRPIITAAPLLVIYVFAQKFLLSGLNLGATKE